MTLIYTLVQVRAISTMNVLNAKEPFLLVDDNVKFQFTIAQNVGSRKLLLSSEITSASTVLEKPTYLLK